MGGGKTSPTVLIKAAARLEAELSQAVADSEAKSKLAEENETVRHAGATTCCMHVALWRCGWCGLCSSDAVHAPGLETDPIGAGDTAGRSDAGQGRGQF